MWLAVERRRHWKLQSPSHVSTFLLKHFKPILIMHSIFSDWVQIVSELTYVCSYRDNPLGRVTCGSSQSETSPQERSTWNHSLVQHMDWGKTSPIICFKIFLLVWKILRPLEVLFSNYIKVSWTLNLKLLSISFQLPFKRGLLINWPQFQRNLIISWQILQPEDVLKSLRWHKIKGSGCVDQVMPCY